MIEQYEFLPALHHTADSILQLLGRTDFATIQDMQDFASISFANVFLDEFAEFWNLSMNKNGRTIEICPILLVKERIVWLSNIVVQISARMQRN